MVNDLISDFLTRIRNAIARKQEEVTMPSSKMLVAVAKILKEENFISDYEVIEAKPQNKIVLHLRYVNGVSAINKLERISKPGVRTYLGYRNMPLIKSGLGISVFSTPKGIMTGKSARKEKVGGEYLCRIW